MAATAESSIRTPGMFVVTIADRVVYEETSKQKILGAGCWRITMPNQIHPGEFSTGGDMDGILHIVTSRSTGGTTSAT